MTYLELINDVLIRLRENEVSTVTQTPYAKMIGKFINDIKREVEDSYEWNCLKDTVTVTTSNGTYNYALTGSGVRFRLLKVINDTSNWELDNVTYQWITDKTLVDTPENGSPRYFAFNGVDSNGDTKADFYPVPDAAYSVLFKIVKPQAALSSASDEILVPSEPVVFGAYAKALAERGEDMGQNSSEAYALYRKSLADHIAIESSRYPNDTIWDLV